MDRPRKEFDAEGRRRMGPPDRCRAEGFLPPAFSWPPVCPRELHRDLQHRHFHRRADCGKHHRAGTAERAASCRRADGEALKAIARFKELRRRNYVGETKQPHVSRAAAVGWAWKDSNLRRHKPSDLQSDPVGHLGTRPTVSLRLSSTHDARRGSRPISIAEGVGKFNQPNDWLSGVGRGSVRGGGWLLTCGHFDRCASFTPFPGSIAKTGGRPSCWRGWRRPKF